jgi:hypothetical protein|tara:strand:- start:748 stop:1170 length:423 start_codon:yes stop_codon:yes gene_type:complete
MSDRTNGNSRKSNESSKKQGENKRVFSSLNLTAKAYLAEVKHQPGKSAEADGMYFARLNLLMGKDGDNYEYQAVSVLVTGKAKQVVEKLYATQSTDNDRTQHALTGVVFDVTIGNVVLGTYETDSSVGVDFKGVLTELAF